MATQCTSVARIHVFAFLPRMELLSNVQYRHSNAIRTAAFQPPEVDLMADVFGVFGPQAFVVLIVALIGLGPVVLYYSDTYRWFVFAYGFLLVAAFATNFENVFLPDLLNYTEHIVGNMGAGIAFAVAAYLYRKHHIIGEVGDTQTVTEG